jgi:hypothetical protein
MPSNEEIEAKAEHYRSVTVPQLIEGFNSGDLSALALTTRARAELSGFNFGLTNEEYDKIVGKGPDSTKRYEKLCKVMGWIIEDGTLMAHTPGEFLRECSSGWPGLTPPNETRPYLDLLASDEEADLMILKRSLEEVLGRRHHPFEE